MKQFLGRLRHNTGMKLIALFFAVLTWSFVISVEDLSLIHILCAKANENACAGQC